MRVLVGMETPLRGRSGGHIGAAPTVSFGQIVRGRLVSFGQITRGCPPPICVYSFVHLFTHENAVSPCKSAFGNKSYL